MSRTLRVDAPWQLSTLDQTLLPFEVREIRLGTAEQCHEAITAMRVRGAPLIGAVGAFGLAMALRQDASDEGLARLARWMSDARPTAVNLSWAVERVRRVAAASEGSVRAERAWAEAQHLCDEDAECNRQIGEHGASLLGALRRSDPARPLQILTHCNAGRIATVEHGTALAPVYRLHQAGVPVHVWVDETRPRNQGAALTAWELAQAGVPHTVIVDNAGGLLMMRGRIDAVITGCDRVAANGDVANKIGTYLKALAAADNGIPFYVACPLSTVDPGTADGAAIAVEERSAREVTHLRGQLADGRVAEIRLVPEGAAALNPGFDITPGRLVTALITERGPAPASPEGLRGIFPEGFAIPSALRPEGAPT